MSVPVPPTVTVTVGIKALNEDRHIADALASACAAALPLGGEVILADCGSTDRTVEIARGFPARVLQLADPAQRSCGTGAQLAFQQAHGRWFYLLDGDMVLDPHFLAAGIAFLEAHPDHAGVGGRVHEAVTSGIEFELRARSDAEKGSAHAGEVDRLDCGGLYRAEAVRAAGYFADRNLHAFEEFDLGARLRARGWKLARIAVPAVSHHGHAQGGLALMLRRLRSGYAGAPGEVLRAALEQGHWRQVLRDFAQLRFGVAILGWWAALLICTLLPGLGLGFGLGWAHAGIAALGLLALPVGYFTWRRGSLRLGLYSLATWNLNAIGLLQGVFRPRRTVREPIPAHDLGIGGSSGGGSSPPA